MKVLVELLVIVSLIALGWRQPFRYQVERVFGVGQDGAPASRARGGTTGHSSDGEQAPTPQPLSDNSWLWKPSKLDPKHR